MATKEQLRPFFSRIYKESDVLIERLLIAYFVFGIGLSFVYDTYKVGIGVGLLALGLYYSAKWAFPDKRVNQYMASLVAGIFMAQFIYQMHGLFEMHFTAFIAIIALITYQNKWAFIPQFLFVLIHHSSFAYIQYLGYTNEIDSYKQIYFTQLDYMDFSTFLFHAGLYGLGIVIAFIYAHNLEKGTKINAESIIKLENEEELIKENIVFAKNIADGNYNADYTLIDGDQMGVALVDMRNNLKISAERERQERFINIGIAQISDIIRNHNEKLEDLSYEIVRYLAKYMQLNQGGIFIVMDDENDIYLELKGCYAYERKKYLTKRVAPGEGLVGQCYLEKEVIYMKDVPQNYIRITSGLGDALPSNLVIIPIKTEDTIEGVMELASFKDLEDFEIEFLKKVSETVATTIASAKINAKTKILYEQSQQQTEEMRAQEEEMRQNMEELSATQEEMERKSKEFQNRFRAINESGVGSIELDLYGNIQEANDAFCELLECKKSEITGSHHRQFVSLEYSKSEDYKLFWQQLASGQIQKGEYDFYTKSGRQIKVFGSYSIIRDMENKPVGVLGFVVDISNYQV